MQKRLLRRERLFLVLSLAQPGSRQCSQMLSTTLSRQGHTDGRIDWITVSGLTLSMMFGKALETAMVSSLQMLKNSTAKSLQQ